MVQQQNAPLILGEIVGLFGVKGWVKIRSHTRPREGIFSYNPWLLGRDSHWRPVELVTGKSQGKGLVAQLQGITDRDQAASLIGTEIAIDRDQLPKLPEGEFYWWQLEGLQVKNLQDQVLGTVEKLMETGANDVLIVKSELAGEEERLIPHIPDVVLKVDLEAGTLIVDWDKDY
jgi:16S rRNA processing protein RimM